MFILFICLTRTNCIDWLIDYLKYRNKINYSYKLTKSRHYANKLNDFIIRLKILQYIILKIFIFILKNNTSKCSIERLYKKHMLILCEYCRSNFINEMILHMRSAKLNASQEYIWVSFVILYIFICFFKDIYGLVSYVCILGLAKFNTWILSICRKWIQLFKLVR